MDYINCKLVSNSHLPTFYTLIYKSAFQKDYRLEVQSVFQEVSQLAKAGKLTKLEIDFTQCERIIIVDLLYVTEFLRSYRLQDSQLYQLEVKYYKPLVDFAKIFDLLPILSPYLNTEIK